ncbi:21172_t:CDS:2 [Gigaspora margarita]|uniref:21172_t:CDS:1 n=1 Tax=Gigaspora margarita TaxID=4874 RepID=A0ABN7WFF2_GIGMA|nr:21172_t:CDS:2 [Gigaspora margarita]
MPLHVALLVAITSVKKQSLFSYGFAKYKFLKEISQTIRWKYFFPTNKQPQQFTPSDLVFISGKYIIENLEQCITISYASIINNENPNYKFNISDVPEYVPHCMISVIANCKLKEVEDYVHFGVESFEYNSITGSSDVKMQITVLYSSQAIRFQKYLGISSSNIKLRNTYFMSGFFKFLKSGQIIIEAIDINYLRTSTLNYNTFENSSLIKSSNRSIIDIIANDIESVSAQILLKHARSSASSDKLGNIDNENNGPDFEDEDELDDNTHIEDEECEENLQPKNEKGVLELTRKRKKNHQEK